MQNQKIIADPEGNITSEQYLDLQPDQLCSSGKGAIIPCSIKLLYCKQPWGKTKLLTTNYQFELSTKS